MADYSLPELPYDYAALEPYISGEIMELHHDKHHATYVKGINTAVDQLSEMRDKEEFTFLGTLEKNLAFHLGGHVNHSVFWTNMSPDGGDKPVGDLAARIDADFGSFDKFRAQFEANALGVQGSGWSVLTWDMVAQKLYIVQHFDHQGNVPICMVPLLMLDMWEHSYYLQYKNDKATFVKQWWNIVNWADVQARFEKASKQTPGLIV
ncbi:superoxide dismutase [Dermacoccus nishinomiyaensis]|uniref:superoxide dismutase n=1 Tax=Dermacoccus TaxID=57495 RepID=UPI0001E6409B|nr:MULTISPECIES: superoxide dismutase [Dermacoccus]EFP59242.1 superoxide dismutase, Mn/Fe family [Dermacoccus sp. Ellin185]MBO1756961.1 superoxide dismutase [Dermacoccus sp. NHGro5]MCI0153531.1 superoxide dismutase [Dermacoccus nishinomiyaensis]MCT1605080.1 superoxide dismutase [Dermacoccus nishinomiyaensis]TJZ96672.1 superoxide dismutase [Dermacoccus nishinomiyaensis]